MELYVYSRDMTLQGIVEKISSLIWTRRYWSCGEFKLLVPFTEEHARLLVKENIIIKRGGNEAAEIRYIHITKNSQGMEEIEVQGKFLLSWIGKRILTTQIITKDTTQNILYAIVKQTCTNAGAARNIPNFSISTTDADTGSGQIDYTSEQYANAQLAAETAAKAAKLGIRVLTNARTGKHTFSVYPSNSVTLITEKIIQLMCFDAKEPNNSNSDRKQYGNNRYQHSNILQWLNSNAAAGAWYSAKHSADAPPTNANVWNNYNEYDAWAGFLAMLDPKFVAELLTTTQTVARNTVTDGGSYETVTSKMFLPSTTEVGLANENNIAEGTLLALFSNDASRVAYPTAQCVSNSEYTNSNFSTSKGWYWWLRTPNSSGAYTVRSVYSDGSLNNGNAHSGGHGFRPLCNLKSSILVSDSPNSDGNYTVIYNSAPSAPPSITAPATCYSGQNINISCAAATDPDGDALTYCFERSYNSGAWTQVQASASRTFTEAVSTAWNTLKYRVRAKDSYGNYSAYTTSGDIAVIHNQPPVISGSNADLGIKRADFTYQYSVTDPDGDTVNVVEKIDGKTIATKNAITLGATQTLSVSGNTFTALTNAKHTITITATDSAGNSAVRTLTFTKSIAGFVITLSAPLEADSQPTRANIKVTRDIPAGGTFKVEATNNPFDASPVWEDCTNAVVQGVAHVFTNKINTAAQYGMNIRVTVQRGDALTACWVSGIGGNFE